MKFCLIEHSWHPKKLTEWFILVSTHSELMEWYQTQGLTREGLMDYAALGSSGGHARTVVGSFLESISRIKHDGAPLPIANRAEIITDALYRPKADMISSGSTLLINDNGAFRPLSDDITVLVRVDRDAMDWPVVDGEIKIMKWPGGRHHYAKVGAHDVVIDQTQKWDTHTEAMNAAVAWISARSTVAQAQA